MADDLTSYSESTPLELGLSIENFESEFSIVDERAAMRPSEYVLRQFLSHTRNLPVNVSSLRMRRTIGR